MPWKECSVMDEILQLLPANYPANATQNSARSSGYPEKQDIKSSSAISSAGLKGLRIEAASLYIMRIRSRFRLRPTYSTLKKNTRVGVRVRVMKKLKAGRDVQF
jgi:hypothetical protein